MTLVEDYCREERHIEGEYQDVHDAWAAVFKGSIVQECFDSSFGKERAQYIG